MPPVLFETAETLPQASTAKATKYQKSRFGDLVPLTVRGDLGERPRSRRRPAGVAGRSRRPAGRRTRDSCRSRRGRPSPGPCPRRREGELIFVVPSVSLPSSAAGPRGRRRRPAACCRSLVTRRRPGCPERVVGAVAQRHRVTVMVPMPSPPAFFTRTRNRVPLPVAPQGSPGWRRPPCRSRRRCRRPGSMVPSRAGEIWPLGDAGHGVLHSTSSELRWKETL